jgi:hypothetical protein
VGIAGIGHPARLIGIDAYAADAPRPRLASAIQCALDKGAKVINVSIQGLAAPEMPADLKAALDRAEALAVLVVMAAGNGIGDLDKEPEWPAAYRTHTTLTVTAVDLDDRLTGQRFGLHSVDLAVPAREDMVCSTLPESIPPHETKSAGCGVKGQEHSPYGRFGQTSAAAAIVSGAALLLWSHPNYRDCSAAEIRALLLKHARVPDAEATRTALSPFGGVLDVAFLATVVRNRAGVIDLCSGVVTSEAATEESVPRSDGESHPAKDRSSGNEQP